MNQRTQSPVIAPAGAGMPFELGDHRGLVKVSAQDTSGAFLFTEIEADYNGGVPPHIHNREDETFYITSGRFVFGVGGTSVEVGPGATVYGPREIPHTWACISPEGGKLVILFTPGDNFQAFGLAMAERGIVPQEAMTDPVKAATFVALAAEYGIEMLPPGK